MNELLQSRESFASYIELHGYKSAAEIGVRAGGFSRFLLENTTLTALYSIDPWSDLFPEFAGGEDQARATLMQFGERSTIIKAASTECFRLFPDESLDFIYIDAGHDYESVRTDIALFWPKVRIGGTMAGHDYTPCWPGVIRAVDEHASLHSLDLGVTGVSTHCAQNFVNGEEWGVPSWYVVKA